MKLSIAISKELASQIEEIKQSFGLESDEEVIRAGFFVLAVFAEAKKLDEKIVMIDGENNITRELIFEQETEKTLN